MNVITYRLYLEEPLLMTAPGGDPNADNSYDFVPGSALRGALVKRYLQQGGSAADARFTRLFLDGRVRFLNAYPVAPDGKRALPTPGSWVLEKDGQATTIYDRALGEEPGLPKRVGRSFVQIGEDTATPLDSAFQVSIHTSRNREKGRAIEGDPGSAVYQYRALAAATRFGSAIVVDSGAHAAADAARLADLLSGAHLLLGGSQTAGYGLTRVEEVAQPESWRETGGAVAAVAAGEPLVLYLLSDAILRDPETGRESNRIIPLLPPGLQAKVKPAPAPHTFARMTWVSGFNTTWGLPLPQEWAVGKGSLWRLEATAVITGAEIATLEAAGIGQRRAEGFGRLAVNPPWLTEKERSLAEAAAAGVMTTGSAPEAAEPAAVQTQAAALVQQMNQRLLAPALDRRLVVTAQKKAQKRRGRLSGSQLARIRLRVRRQQDGFDDFAQYLKGTRRRKSADDQFRKFRVDGRNFRDWLEALAENPEQVWDEILPQDASWQPSTLTADAFKKEDAALIHHYAVRFIDAVCEQLSKGMNQNG